MMRLKALAPSDTEVIPFDQGSEATPRHKNPKLKHKERASFFVALVKFFMNQTRLRCLRKAMISIFFLAFTILREWMGRAQLVRAANS